MYAIIKTGGKQLKVEVGQAIYVEKLNVAEGEVVTFDEVLFVGGENAKVLMELDGGGYGRTFNYNGAIKDFVNNYEKTFNSNRHKRL